MSNESVITTLSMQRSPAKTSSLLHLGRSNRYGTLLGWRPIVPEQKVRLSVDQSAVLMAADLKSIPEKLKKGTRYEVQLDGVIQTRGYWAMMSIHEKLYQYADVQFVSMLTPNEQHRPVLWIRPRSDMDASSLPDTLAYVFLVG